MSTIKEKKEPLDILISNQTDLKNKGCLSDKGIGYLEGLISARIMIFGEDAKPKPAKITEDTVIGSLNVPFKLKRALRRYIERAFPYKEPGSLKLSVFKTISEKHLRSTTFGEVSIQELKAILKRARIKLKP